MDEKLLGALARGYCSKENENKVVNPTFINAMAEEVVKAGFSRRQELDEDALAIELYKHLVNRKDGDWGICQIQAKVICAKFKAPDAPKFVSNAEKRRYEMQSKNDAMPTADLTKENEVLREQNLALNKSNSELVEALRYIARSYHMQHAFDIAIQALSNHAKGDGGV